MSKIEVNTIEPQSGTTVTIGASGDTITIPSGATLDASNATTTLPANVVTTDGTQTLTNKSIAATQLTGTITPSDGTVTTAKLADSSVSTVKLQDSSVTTAKLNDASVSLAKLTATGTKDATTFLRGDNTFAEAGGGKVLQVVQTADNTEATSTSTFQRLSTSITPSATSSKVLVLAQVSYYSTNDHAYGILRRGGSSLFVGTGASGVNITVGALDNNNYGGNSNTPTGSSIISYLDSPNSTSAQTYDFSMSGDTSFTIYWNKAASGKYVMTSSMTLIEIGA